MEASAFSRILRRWWLAATAVGILVVAAFVAAALAPAASYKSGAVLNVTPDATSVTQGGALESLMPPLAERIKSGAAHSEIAKKTGIKQTWTTGATTEAGTGLLRLSVTSPDPQVSRRVAAAYSVLAETFMASLAPDGVVRVIEPAGVGSSARRSRAITIIAAGLVLGVVAGISSALLLDKVARRRSFAREVSLRFHVPVLAEVPRRRGRRGSMSPSVTYSPQGDPAAADAFVRLLEAVQPSFDSGQIRSVAVVADQLGTGASTVAAHLAWTLASVGRTVLLVDTDAHDRGAFSLLGSGLRSGQGGRLRLPGGVIPAASPLPSLVVLSPNELADVARLAGGAQVTHPAMAAAAGLPIVARAAAADDALVVADAPALSSAAGGVSAVHACDAVILVLNGSKRVRADDAGISLDLLRRTTGTHVLGVVVNWTKPSRRALVRRGSASRPAEPESPTQSQVLAPAAVSSTENA